MHKWLSTFHDHSESITRTRPPQSRTKMTSRTVGDANSSSLHSKLHALSKLKNKISDQESRLDTLYGEKSQLEREIAELQNRCLSINQLPVDAISHIFDYVIVLNPNVSCGIHEAASDRIALMHTCKHWRKIIIDSPLLWNAIYIKPPDHDGDHPRWVKRFYLYLGQCILHSQGVALDIVLDLRLLMNGFAYVSNQITSSLSSFCSPGDLAEWSQDIDKEACPVAVAYDSLFKTLIGNIFGPESAFLHRLRGLYLTLPSAVVPCQTFWDTIIETIHQRQVTDHNFDTVPLPQATTMSSQALSLTRRLTIFDTVLGKLPPMPHLHSLTLSLNGFSFVPEEYMILSQLPSLRHLIISGWRLEENQPYEGVDTRFIKIPSLDLLALRAPVHSVVIQAFEFQKLGLLVLEENYQYEQFPQAQLFSVAEMVALQTLIHRDDEEMRRTLFPLFLQLSRVHTIAIPEHAYQDAMFVIGACQDQEALPWLRKVQILDSN